MGCRPVLHPVLEQKIKKVMKKNYFAPATEIVVVDMDKAVLLDASTPEVKIIDGEAGDDDLV